MALFEVKFRFTYLLSFSIAVLALLPSVASAGSRIVTGLHYEKAGVRYSVTTTSILRGDIYNKSAGTENGGTHSGTRIQQSTDVAIYSSIVPACDVILSLIGLLHPQKPETDPHILQTQTQQAFFKVLFQVIMAPNAP
jgi:hypothetical protein